MRKRIILGVWALFASIFLISFAFAERAHIVLSDDENFVFMENDGTGKFTQTYIKETTIDQPHEITAGDFDLDGIWDAAVNHWQEGKFSVFWGGFEDGKRTFNEQVYDIGRIGEMHAIGSGDFDEDGDVDLALVDNENAAIKSVVIAFSEGKGSRSFSRFERYDMPNNENARTIEVNDFNGDKHLDIIIPEARENTFYIFFNDKDGVLGKFSVEERGGGGRLHFIESGDIDGDGDNDLALADSVGIYLMKNNGLGEFSLTEDKFCIKEDPNCPIDPGNPRPQDCAVRVRNSQGECVLVPDFYSVELSDLNNDGFLDIAGIKPDGLYVWVWDGTRFKGAPNQMKQVNLDNPLDIETADVDNDGFKDLIVGTVSVGVSGIRVFNIKEDPKNLGALMIIPKSLYRSTGNAVGRVMIDVYYEKEATRFIRADIDNSGILDITDAITLLGYLFQAGKEPTCLDAADVDDSGILDLTDAIYLLQRLFQGGAEIPEPRALGVDPTGDGLDCKCYGSGC